MLSAEQMVSLPEFFADIPDPRWNVQQAATDEGLAIDAEDRQAHILGGVGHQSQTCHTQQKSAPCP
jgi:hypothetical protein